MPLPIHLVRKLAQQRAEQSAQVPVSVEPDLEKNNNVLVVAPVSEPVHVTPVEVVPEPVHVTPVEVVLEPVHVTPVEVVPEPVEPVSCCANGTCTENCCCKPVEPEV